MAKRPKKATLVDSLVATRVRQRRIVLGLSLCQFAEIMGVTYQQAQKYETGINHISAARLYEIACALNTPIADFFGGLGEDPRPLTSCERRLLNVARHFVEIQNEKHRMALFELVRSLADG